MQPSNYSIREENLKKFQDALSQLNSEQRKAVENIYGPVMVLAGPGTGKTQLLALRVCNILNLTDSSPDNVLCITFTDSGSYAMKARLSGFMGADAYKVNIFTYHAFCHKVIKENLEYFGNFRELNIASDLDKKEIIVNLIDNLPLNHPLKRHKGDIYNDSDRLEYLFKDMKKEGWTEEYLLQKIDHYISSLPNDEKYIYKRSGKDYKKGDLKINEINEENDRVNRTKAAIELFKEYNHLLRSKSLIDFEDVILMVIEAFEKHKTLLLRYQEQFQFILVDEYQDSNGAQNRLLRLLCEYDDPNIFVVGDDDQAIYRFQGANMANIEEFYELFRPKIYVLSNNYRSQQKILDSAHSLIEYNFNRLINNPNLKLEKSLTAAGNNKNYNKVRPEILYYETIQEEEFAVIKRIESLLNSGIKPGDIAIIYRKHKHAENLVRYFNSNNIPVNISKNINALDEPDGVKLIKLLTYIHNEYSQSFSGDFLLYEILSYPFFNIPILDLGKLSYYINQENAKNKFVENPQYRRWREAISDASFLKFCNVKATDNIIKAADLLENLIQDVNNLTVQQLVEKLLTQSGFLSHIIYSDNKYQRLQVINSVFDDIKEKCAQGRIKNLDDLMDTLKNIKKFNIGIPVNIIINSEKGINFVTAHRAKGLEYDYVFMIKCTTDDWIKGGSTQGFSMSFLGAKERDKNYEEERRLFFVGMTRARKELYLSFSRLKDNDKNFVPVPFLSEANLDIDIESPAQRLSADEVLNYTSSLIKYPDIEEYLIDREIVDSFLSDFVLNTTALNNYIDCPLKFYFINVLKVPGARTAAMGYGNAMHYTLQILFKSLGVIKSLSLEEQIKFLIVNFHKSMERYRSHFKEVEFTNHLYLGEQCISTYMKQFDTAWWNSAIQFMTEETIETSINGIPIKGTLDRITINDHEVMITDYKTGRYKKEDFDLPNDTNPGGKYWRQAYFYILLMKYSKKFNKPIQGVNFEYLSADGIDKSEFHQDDKCIEILVSQIENMMSDIKEYKFTPGCNKSDCMWCNFVKESRS